jgi:hypothetical protein
MKSGLKEVRKMPRFIAVHTTQFSEADLKAAAKDMLPKLPPGITWKLTYCDFSDGKFFCEWEAPNKETIEQVFKAANLPFDAVYPVRLLDVAKAEIEP